MSAGTILIVGEGDGAAETRATLKGTPHRVLHAADGATALELLASEPVQLVVAEWEMAPLDGITLCRAVRGDHPRFAAPQFIVIRSRFGHAQPLTDALEAGADDYLTFPFESAELLARVQTRLREVALHADQTRLRALVSNVPGAIYRCSHTADWTMELISDEIERISGYPPSDFIHDECRSFASIIHPDDREEVERAVSAATERDQPFSLEYRLVRADGTTRWAMERGQLVRGQDGREWLDGVIFDITERRRAEEAVRHLETEQARIAELRASRTRIVKAADGARRAIQRDLHDGAQQRLVTLALMLRSARGALAADPAGVGRQLDEALGELGHAIEELRRLARSIHPAVLTDRGLQAALRSLAARAPLPVELEVHSERLPAPVESAAYFVVAEALTNVARYAGATYASVRVVRAHDHVVVEVSDDGIGGAQGSVESGLGGLADRVAALDGQLRVVSPPGAGTTLRAEIPLHHDPPQPPDANDPP